MLAVTIGPIPTWSTDPCAPANRTELSEEVARPAGLVPDSEMFVRKKYNMRMPTVHISFRLKGT